MNSITDVVEHCLVRPKLRRSLSAVLFGILTSIACRAAPLPSETFLRVESGMHEATINAVATLPGGAGLVTVSDDKTARLWSFESLSAMGVIRPPLGPRDLGALYSTAASDKVIAVAGRLRDAAGRYGVALYMRADLSPAGVLWGFPAAVTALRFSASGKMLAVGLQGGAGIRVLDLSAGTTAYHDGPFAGTVNGLDFDRDDRLAVASDDGMLRLYSADGQAVKLPQLPKQAVPWRLAFSPDGSQLAIGDRRQPAVHIFDMRKLRFDPDLRGAPLTAGGLDTVAYAPGGKTLFAAGSYVDRTGQIFIRRFSLDGVRGASDIKATRELVTDLLPLNDGLIVTTADPSILKIDSLGHVVASVRTGHADFHAAGPSSLLVSRDGGLVEFPGANGQRVRFDVISHQIVERDGRVLQPPYAAVRGLAATEWVNSHTPRLNGQVLALESAETARAVAILPDGRSAAIGTDFYVRLAGRAGSIWQTPTEAPVWAVNASGDGRLIVAALGDGTVHWYEVASGRELLALQLDAGTQRFVLWTPNGFFDHDHRTDGLPDGRGLIGYRVNLPSGRDSLFVQIGQLYPLFFRPDLVGLSLRDDEAAQHVLAEQSKLLGSVAAALAGGLPARVTMLDVCPLDGELCGGGATFDPAQKQGPVGITLSTDRERVRIRYRLDYAGDANGGNKGGHTMVQRNDAVITPEIKTQMAERNGRVEEATISLATGTNKIRLTPVSDSGAVEASDANGALFAIERRVSASVPATKEPVLAAGAPLEKDAGRRLYVLSVGVGEFEEDALDVMHLPNAGDDAEAVADMFDAPSPPVYDKPNVTRLLGKKATRKAIVAVLQRIAREASPDDMVIIFLAGHGLSVAGRYYYAAGDLGADAERLNKLVHPASDAESESALAGLYEHDGLSQEVLLPLLQSIQADRVALILDTCYSATAATGDAVLRRDINATVTNRLGHASGRFVLSSAFREARDSGGAGREDHGLFTSYLLQAFEGAADLGHSGIIDIYKLATYMRKSVLAKSAVMAAQLHSDDLLQEPSFYFAGSDFFDLRPVRTSSARVSH